MVSGTQAVSNFRPGVALYYYRRYLPPDGVVLDCCMGYGGRLVGFIAFGHHARYIGIDPNPLTYAGNQRLAEDLGVAARVELVNQPAEDVDGTPWAGRVDLCFTSPPYFRKEVYASDATQSAVRYPEPEAWRARFLLPCVQLQARALKPGGYAVVNIAAVRIGQQLYDLPQWTREAAEAVGLRYVRTERLPLARRFGRGHAHGVAEEPILIFRKPSQ